MCRLGRFVVPVAFAVVIGLGAAMPPAVATSGGPAGHLAGTAAHADASAAATTAPAASRASTRLIVKLRAGTSVATAQRVLAAHGLAVVETLALTGAHVVDLPTSTTVAAMLDMLRADPAVAYAVPDRLRRPATDDPGFDWQWGLRNVGQSLPDGVSDFSPTMGVDVDAVGAWMVRRGSASVTVAVIDQGVDIAHPDLAPAIWTNPGEVAGNGVDDDRDGYVDDVHGWDFAHERATVFEAADGDEHGTHVAGIIGAVAGNGTGIAGLASGVRLMPLKFMTSTGGYDSDAIRAIGYATAHGARVINASWGSSVVSGAGSDDPALRDAIAACGCVFVAAAGNDGVDIDDPAQRVFPAAFGLPNELAIAAVDVRGGLASFSNFGASTVDLAAPGVAVLSTLADGRYGWLSGTSMAAPFVAATAALMFSASPALTPSEVAARIKASARPMPDLAGRVRTGGMLDAGAAMRALGVTPVGPTPTDPVTTAPVTRLAGADRYATAAAVAAQFAPGVATAYVATGTTFPDALAGAALAGSQGAPVLLTTRTSLPAATAEALARLQPGRIVVLGGPGAVSDAVAQALASYTSGPVTRLAGADRYATAAAVAAQLAPGVATAYVATGTTFPDALAGAALAGSQGAPVLLTTRTSLPAATAEALARLQPGRIVVLGGPGAVSDAVAQALASYASDSVTRLAGADRYATAAAVAAQFAPGVATAYVATGTTFPDALAGSALAGSQGMPVLLTAADSVPAPLSTAFLRLAPQRIVVLGDGGAVSDTVAASLGVYSG